MKALTGLILSLVFAVFVAAPFGEAFVCAADDLTPSAVAAASQVQGHGGVATRTDVDNHAAKKAAGCPHGGCCHQDAAPDLGCKAILEVASGSKVVPAPTIQASLRSISSAGLRRPPRA